MTIKALMAPVNIAGMPMTLTRGLQALGVDVRHLQYGSGHKFGYDADMVVELKGKPRLETQLRTAAGLLDDGYNLFHFWLRTLVFERRYDGVMGLDAPLIKARGAKVIYRFTGMDLRDPAFDLEHNPYSPFRYGYAFLEPEEVKRRDAYVGFLGEHVDRFVVQDPEMLQYKPDAQIVPRALDLADWEMVGVAPSDRPLVVHSPSNETVKGTDFVLKAVEDLRETGLSFDFKLIKDMPHAEAKDWYRKADIVVDQLHIGAYGVLSLEAMALGKPVVCYVREDLFRPVYGETPVVNGNPDTIKSVLASLIADYDMRAEHGEKGRAFVERHHDLRTVAASTKALYEDVHGAPAMRAGGAADIAFLADQFGARETAHTDQIREARRARARADRLTDALKAARAVNADLSRRLGRPAIVQALSAPVDWIAQTSRRLSGAKPAMPAPGAPSLQPYMPRYPELGVMRKLMAYADACFEAMPNDVDWTLMHGVQPLPLKRALGDLPICLDCIEIPALADRASIPDISPRVLDWVDRCIATYLPEAEAVWTVSEALKAVLESAGAKNINVMPNYRDHRSAAAPSEGRLRQTIGVEPETPVAVAVGLLASGAEAFLEAMQAAATPFHLVVLGTITPKAYETAILRQAEALGVRDRLHLLPPVPYADLATFMADADMGVIIRDPAIRNNAISLPNKLFDYFAAGLPVAAPAIPDIARRIEAFDCGVVLPEPTAAAWGETLAAAWPEAKARRAGAAKANDSMRWDAHAPLFAEAARFGPKAAIVGSGDLTRNNRTFRQARDLRDQGVHVTLITMHAAEAGRFRAIGADVIGIS